MYGFNNWPINKAHSLATTPIFLRYSLSAAQFPNRLKCWSLPYSQTNSNKSSFDLMSSYVFLLTSTFEQVLMYAGAALTITSSLTVLSLFVLRVRKPELNRPYMAWGYPITPMIYLFSNLWIMYHMFSESTFESILGLSVVMFGIIFYFFLRE